MNTQEAIQALSDLLADMTDLLKQARDFCDEIACGDNPYWEDAKEIIAAIDKVLGENK